jgi:hypothetical protein
MTHHDSAICAVALFGVTPASPNDLEVGHVRLVIARMAADEELEDEVIGTMEVAH